MAEVRQTLAEDLRPVIEGRPVVIRAVRVRPATKSLEIEMTRAEGRHRIVRRLAEELGLKVEWLHRVSYGPVRLGKLAEGQWRALTPREIEAIGRIHVPR